MPSPKQFASGVLHAALAVVKAEPVRIGSLIVGALVAGGIQVADPGTLGAEIGTFLAIVTGGEAIRTQVSPAE